MIRDLRVRRDCVPAAMETRWNPLSRWKSISWENICGISAVRHATHAGDHEAHVSFTNSRRSRDVSQHTDGYNLIDLARGRNILQVLTTAHQQPCLLGHDSRVWGPRYRPIKARLMTSPGCIDQ